MLLDVLLILDRCPSDLFLNADVDRNGVLDRKEFMAVLQSTQLGLSVK